MNKRNRHKFADLYLMTSGISSTPEQAGHGDPFLSFSVVFHNYFLPPRLVDKMDTSASEQKKYSVREGDIFLTRTSEVVDELGMSSVALKDYPKATYSGFLKRLRPVKAEVTYPKFMAFYLRSPLFRKTMTNNTVMTLRASLNEAVFSYFELLLPEYSEQKSIGDLLHLLHEKIDCNNRINAELEAMAKTLYDYWFVQFDFPDANGKPYKTAGGKMVYNGTLKREIPEGWGVLELRDLVHPVKEGAAPSDVRPSTPYIGLEHIGRKTIVLSQWSTSDKATSNKLHFRKNDIILGKIRPYFHKVAIALFDGIASTDAIVLRSKRKNFLGVALETIFTEDFIGVASQSSTGSKMPRADWNVLKHYKVPVPEDALLDDFEAIFEGVIQKIENSVLQTKELKKLRDWLLPMLMNGQVTVA